MPWQFVVFMAACALVGLACLVPNRWLPPLPNDKLLHFGAFGGLAALALPLAADRAEGALWLGGLFLGGWVIEYLQGRLVPDRHFCWRDVAANGGGICFTALCALLLGALQS
jgi:hypothetical protein